MASVALSSLRPAAPGTPELLYGLNPTSLRGSCFPSFPRHDESKGSLSLSIDIPRKRGPWRTAASLFPFLKKKKKDTDALKEELLEAIAPLDRGAQATEEDQKRVDQIARELESDNMIKEPLKSDLLNGKWELIYTTSSSILARQRPKLLRPNGKIYQAINSDTLRAQNMETWPFFNQVTANLVPLNARRVAVRFDTFKIAGLIPIKAPGRGRGELEITYLDDELRKI
ncbi:probable plastid-lipid-associated protein 4, chloroplastic isoform X2 [Nymphaea colorata]|uniref:probable plastid-lipid-associated protein 4, chloroplastic isoform X2 n=1 Tax=Nymphaea colorata TaxID=210225 RepID=UPI00129EE6D3|nr:probable plastid-lipid-associated protein 4, chloroplastic isoform X2 [Nymphaea colorata]